MPFFLQSRIYRADLRANPDALYVFGDNEERWGLGGQAAEMRNEPNAIGVATLKAPGRYWRADDTERQCAMIDRDMAPLFEAAKRGAIIVMPLDGIGTGLADLANQAPETFEHLQRQLAELQVFAQVMA
jgi:hypothetical protein